tara:strand:+ start:1173 stop:1349 length:177 start_codon:yes stop_codon:yes gene_type:complete
MKNLKTFEKEIQDILDKFQFVGETRRKIFSQIMEYASEQDEFEAEQQAGNPQKGSQND